MADSSTASGGTSIVGLLGVAFVILKLVGVITWPWLWVLAPFWASFALLGAGFAIFGVIYGVAKLADKRKAKVRARGWEGGA